MAAESVALIQPCLTWAHWWFLRGPLICLKAPQCELCCRAIRHSRGLCAQGPLHSFTAGRSSWEKCTISRKPPWEAKIIAHATFRPTHHLNHFFIKKEVLSRANMALLWIHCGIWATGLKRAAEELMEKERWREEMEGRREGHHFRTLSSGRVGG